MTLSSTTLAPAHFLSQAAYAQLDMADIRCVNCGKLIVRWLRYGRACIEYKCTRCSHRDIVNLST